MFCKKCGVENDDNAQYCKACGEVLEKTVISNTIRKGKYRMIGIVGAILAIIVIIGLTVNNYLEKRPINEEKIIEDFNQTEFEGKNLSVEDTTVISRTTDKQKDEIIISVTCTNKKVRRIEKYSMQYKFFNKDIDKEHWILQDIVPYEKDTWEIHPLVKPTMEEMRQSCKDYLYRDESLSEYSGYIDITVPEKEPDVDLEKETACFYININKNDDPLRNVYGEIQFESKYDSSVGGWSITNCKKSDSFIDEPNYNHTWYDTIIYRTFYKDDNTNMNHEFTLSQVNIEEDQVSAIFTEDGEPHQMSGTFNDDVVVLTDVNNNLYRIEGYFSYSDGTFHSTLYRYYDLSKKDKGIFYLNKFELDMEIQQ